MDPLWLQYYWHKQSKDSLSLVFCNFNPISSGCEFVVLYMQFTHPHTTYLICRIWYLFTQKALDVAQRNTRPSNLGTSIRDDIEEEREMLQRERDQLHKQIEHMQVCLLTPAVTGFLKVLLAWVWFWIFFFANPQKLFEAWSYIIFTIKTMYVYTTHVHACVSV